MKILVLDTIHGGKVLAGYLRLAGHDVDTVDVYRGRDGSVTEEEALGSDYDLIASPVHLDPDHRLLSIPGARVVSHHEAAAIVARVPDGTRVIEITGARGKTTTAHALAHIMPGKGLLHTSRGAYLYPERKEIFRESITPATFLKALSAAGGLCDWIIAEESIGVTGLGELCILTSGDDYRIAAGKKSALSEKIRHIIRCKKILLGPGARGAVPRGIYAGDIAEVSGDRCTFSYAGMSGVFENELLMEDGYREALITAAAAGCILGENPAGLETFTALEGRLSYCEVDSTAIIDDSNSGTNKNTAVAACAYARRVAPDGRGQVLVIGVEADNICEGFPDDEIAAAISEAGPEAVVVISRDPEYVKRRIPEGISFHTAKNLDDGRETALKTERGRTVVLSVKSWR